MWGFLHNLISVIGLMKGRGITVKCELEVLDGVKGKGGIILGVSGVGIKSKVGRGARSRIKRGV